MSPPVDEDGAQQAGEAAADPAPFAPFALESSQRIYDSPWCGLRRDMIRLPGGKQQDYHVFEVTDAVVVVPVLRSGQVLMIWQYRYPHGRTHWEVPAGRLRTGEDPEVGAARELREETGHKPGRLERIQGFFPINGISAHYAHAYIAWDCERVGDIDLDDSEQLSVHALDTPRVREMLTGGRIEDGFSALALYGWLARS